MKRIPNNKKIIAWGVDITLEECMKANAINIEYAVDNQEKKWGTSRAGCNIFPPSELLNEDKNKIFIIVFAIQYVEISAQLKSMGFEWGVNAECFLFLNEFADLDEIINKETDYHFLRHLVETGSTCIDVGANYGIFSKKMSKLAGENGLVYSIEPHPSAYSGLERLVSTYCLSNIAAYNIALVSDPSVSDVEMVTPLLNGVPRSGMTSIVDNLDLDTMSTNDNKTLERLIGEGSSLDFTKSEAVKVPSTTLDRFVTQQKFKNIDFIKIDVEGYELEVLKGAATVLTEFCPLLQIEIAFNYRSEKIFLEIVTLLNKFGYKVFVASSGELLPFNELEIAQYEHNYYFKKCMTGLDI